jgi:hypothetical protein
VFAKLIGALFIIIGIAGLVLPVVPGILLITAGILLFFKDKEYEIIKLINEKAPPGFASFYHDHLSRIVNGGRHIGIDWIWVKNELKVREKIGAIDNTDRGNAISRSLDECLNRAKSLSEPNYIRVIKNISFIGEDFIELEGGIRFSTGRIAQYIKGSSKIVIFLVTIGGKIEKIAGELTSGDEPLQGYLFDRIGSFAAESLAESVERKIREDYSKLNMSVSRRYSPGYCDWTIEEQRALAGALDFSRIGVSLNESCMMKPKKSISAILAIADKGVFTKSGSTCGICEKKDCSYRRDT